MLRYLAGLQGRQRELSVQKAQKIVDQYGEEGQSSAQSKSNPPPPPCTHTLNSKIKIFLICMQVRLLPGGTIRGLSLS